MDGKNKAHRLLNVIEDPASGPDGFDDSGEIVVENHQRGGFTRDIGAAPAHGDADVGGLEGRRVIDPVAGHRHDLTIGFEGFYQGEFLFRQDARKNRCSRRCAGAVPLEKAGQCRCR